MAITSSINFDKVSGGIKSLNTGMGQLKKSADNVKNVTLNKTKIKRESIVRNRMLSNIREEAVKRKDQESIIEASGISGAFKRTGSVIANSTKGFLGRLLDFASSLLLGWLLYNLPTIMTAIEDLIIRIKSLYTILTDFMSNIKNTFQDFGNLLSAVYQDITHFDFTDQSKRVQSAMDDLGANIDAMHDQFEDGFKLLTTPLGQGPGETPPAPLNTDYRQSAPTTDTTGGSVTGIHKQALDIISGPESGGSYNAMNQGTIGEKIVGSTGNSKTKVGKELTSMTLGEIMQRQAYVMDKRNPQISNYGVYAAGRYQIIPITFPSAMKGAGLKPTDTFSPENQDKMGLAVLKSQGIGAWTAGGSRYSAKETAIIKEAQRTPVTFSSLTSQPAPSKPQSGKGNGFLTSSDLMKIKSLSYTADYQDWYGNNAMLNPTAGKAFLAAQQAYGKDIPINSAYRSYEHQRNVKGSVRATPGYSRHGVGLALDLQPGSDSYNWMMKNGSKYGWYYASIPGDPYHFEYKGGGVKPLQAQVSSTTAPGQNVPAIAQNKKGQQIIIADNPQPSAPQQVISRGGGGSQSMPIEDSLNSLIKNQILLELAYT
jgi:hypothetical protein